MTVCIAAMCHWHNTPMIVGASDRMITAGDTEFEPPQPKIYQLTSSIVMLIAGDTAAQVEIRDGALRDVTERLARDQSWMPVAEAADVVSRNSLAFVRRRAERTVLAPFGLTLDTFIARQGEMAPAWVGDISNRILACRPNTSTLVVGVDLRGPHIIEIESSGHVVSRDAAAFGAIGWGRRHAESQFMFAQHAPFRQFPETLLLTYAAKKRSEVAPGVGSETDVFIINGLGGYFKTASVGLKQLIEVHNALRSSQDAAHEQAKVDISEYFEAMLRSMQQQAESSGEQALGRNEESDVSPTDEAGGVRSPEVPGA